MHVYLCSKVINRWSENKSGLKNKTGVNTSTKRWKQLAHSELFQTLWSRSTLMICWTLNTVLKYESFVKLQIYIYKKKIKKLRNHSSLICVLKPCTLRNAFSVFYDFFFFCVGIKTEITKWLLVMTAFS